MPASYHTHTPLCRHATGSPEAFVEAALAAGLTEYGVSEHAPAVPEPFDDWRMLSAEMPLYLQWIDRAEAAAAGRIPVRRGLECDWFAGCERWIESLAAPLKESGEVENIFAIAGRGGLEVAHRAPGAVRDPGQARAKRARAVVDEDDLEGFCAALEHRLQPRQHRPDIVGLVVDGDDDAEFRGRGGFHG